MIPVLFGMQSAGFSTEDVLYTEFTTEDSFSRSLLPVLQNVSYTLNLTSFKTNLDEYLSSNPDIGPRALAVLETVQSELEDQSSVDINRWIWIRPKKDVTIKNHFVITLWDNDTSVIDAIDKIRNNETLTDQPFTGDEIFTTVKMSRTSEQIYGTYNERSLWSYATDAPAIGLQAFVRYLYNHPAIAQVLVEELDMEEDFGRLQYALGEARDMILTKAQARENTHIAFSVSQMQVNELNLGLNNNGQVVTRDIGVTLVEHQSMGLTVFNDSNANGMMDLGMRTIQSDRPGLNGTVLPTRSNESLYRVDFVGASESTYTPVAKTTSVDELTFAFEATDVNVKLNPIYQNRDVTVFSDDYVVGGEQTIEEFGFTFRFQPNHTSGSADVKFDYTLGQWSNLTVLEGLSLNHMIVTGVKDFSGQNRVMRVETNNTNDEFNPEATAERSRSLKIRVGQSPLADVDLDAIPYLWDGTDEVDAVGQTLPLMFVNLLFGQTTTEADIMRTVGGEATSAKYLYSVSYPKFSGKSIEHDPTYSMVAGVSGDTSNTDPSDTETSGSVDETSAIPGYELVSLVLGLFTTIVLVQRRRR